ncbi:MAG TPA: double zinc ribbon domain-containing protein [Actinomycetota bacterium]
MLDAIFPPRCLGCSRRGVLLCERCVENVGVIVPPLCERCGRPWAAPVEACADCPPGGIDLARSPFLYEGPIAAAIRGMKFGGWRALAPRLAAAIGAVLPEPGVDAVCWVPLSARRRRRRGFDQAEVLGRRVARLLGLPAAGLLRRRRDTAAQARLGGAERRAALVGAFRARRRVPRSVLLVDDVLTTGATAAACAAALREGGADRVVVATAARSVRGPFPAGTFGGSPGPARRL